MKAVLKKIVLTAAAAVFTLTVSAQQNSVFDQLKANPKKAYANKIRNNGGKYFSPFFCMVH